MLPVVLLLAIRWAEAAEPTASPAPGPAPGTAEALSSPPVAPPAAVEAPVADPVAESAPVGGVVDRVVAVVNDDILTLSEVYAFGGPYIEDVVRERGPSVRRDAEAEVIERLIERRLVEQEMRALKLDLTDADLDRTITDVAERNGLDVEGLRREVEKSGMPWDQYRNELRESLRDMKFAQSVLRPRINITEDELRDAWKRASPAAAASARVQALVLAVPPGASDADKSAVVARAKELQERANKGEDFAALSREFDQGPFGAQGGEMGVFKPGELVDALDTVIVNEPLGHVSDPIVIGDGVYLLRIAEREAGSNDFEARRDELSEQVFESRLADEKERWFQEARRRAAIRILLPGGSPTSG